MPDHQKIKTLIGFALRAGKVIVGRSAVVAALEKKQIRLIVISEDASEKLDFLQSPAAQVRSIRFGNKEELGAWFGRKEVAVFALTDAQFSHALEKAAANP
jgi:ribosomal protein L7Ae-like RNA K-turn-binding protein